MNEKYLHLCYKWYRPNIMTVFYYSDRIGFMNALKLIFTTNSAMETCTALFVMKLVTRREF